MNMTFISDQFSRFCDLLSESTSRITVEYFKLPIVDLNRNGENFKKAFVYRERVYCYELYHQLRTLLNNQFKFMICGEVDKTNHPIISKKIGDIIPDLLVHTPGEFGKYSNLVVIEVKSTQKKPNKLIEDFNKIKQMLDIENGYHKGIMLVFGEISSDKMNKFIQIYRNECKDHYEKIKLYFHSTVGEPAKEVK